MKIIITLILMAVLSGCGSPALIVKNNSGKVIKVDVISSSNPRKPFLRNLDPTMTFNSKLCAKEVQEIWISQDSEPERLSPSRFCDLKSCKCKVTIGN